MQHGVLELIMVLSFTQYGESENKISADPRRPIPKDLVTVKCEWIEEDIKKISLTQSSSSFICEPPNKEPSINPDLNWRSLSDISVACNYDNKFIALAYTAKEYEPNEFTCTKEVNDDAYSWIHRIEIPVVIPPTVKEIQVISNSEDKSSIQAGDFLTIRCIIALGKPETHDQNVTFTAPGIGSKEFGIEKKKLTSRTATGIYELNRTMTYSSNGKTIECFAKNEAGNSSKSRILTSLYGARDIEMSSVNFTLLEDSTIFFGEKIRCSADGNPKPNISITVANFPESEQSWAGQGASGISQAILTIPRNATFARYHFSCNASNQLDSKFINNVSVYVISSPIHATDEEMAPYVYSEGTKNTAFFVWICISAVVSVVAGRSV